MTYEDLILDRSDTNFETWQKNVVECLCFEMGFDNKEVMSDAFERAYEICFYMSDDTIDPDMLYDVVEEFIEFYKKVTR